MPSQFAERANEIPVPTLLVAGSYDSLLTLDPLRTKILTEITGARMFPLPCGHYILQEMPPETATLMAAFLAGIGQATGLRAPLKSWSYESCPNSQRQFPSAGDARIASAPTYPAFGR